MAEIGMRRAGRDNQIIEGEDVAVDRQLARHRIDRAYISQQHTDIFLMTQHPANRRRDVAWRQRCRRHLIQQRLEEMVVVAIDQRDANRRVPERARGVEAAEPAADDDDVRNSHGTRSGSGNV